MATQYNTIQAFNADLLIDVSTLELQKDADSGDSTLTVVSILGVSVGDYIMIGEFGSETSEIQRVHTGTAPSGNTITLAGTLTYDHPRGIIMYIIDRNQVEFSRATTLTGSKSVLATVDIAADQIFTIYEDTTNTTGFGFYRWKNEGDTTYSNYSESTPYAGYGQQSLKKIFDSALGMVALIDEKGLPEFTDTITRALGVIAVNDCQQEMKEIKRRWSYLTDFDVVVSELETGQDSYELPSTIASEEGGTAIFSARVGSERDLTFRDKRQFDLRRVDVNKTTLGAAISTTGDVTATLTDSSDFLSAGSLLVIDDDNAGTDTIPYTSNNKATNVVSGVTDIDETHANGALVWQGVTLAEPRVFSVFEGNIKLDPPPSATFDNVNLYINMYTNAVVTDDLADEAKFPASVVKYYVAYRFALLLDGGAGPRSAELYQKYQIEQNKIVAKETTGQFTKLRPAKFPDMTTNMRFRRRRRQSNT